MMMTALSQMGSSLFPALKFLCTTYQALLASTVYARRFQVPDRRHRRSLQSELSFVVIVLTGRMTADVRCSEGYIPVEVVQQGDDRYVVTFLPQVPGQCHHHHHHHHHRLLRQRQHIIHTQLIEMQT